MELEKIVPLIMYDDRCRLCARFARAAGFLAGGRLLLVGHYSELGEKLRDSILDHTALEMFWLVDGKTAFGGRAALLPLLKTILSRRGDAKKSRVEESCGTGCSGAGAVFLRSASLLRRSRKIPI